MAKTQILDYYMHLTDRETVDRYNDQLANPATLATASPGGIGGPSLYIPHTNKFAVLRAPDAAAVEFSAPVQDENVNFSAPCTRSPWFVPGANNFPRNVATFTRKSGGWFGISALFGQTTKFYWAGHFLYSQPQTTNPEDGTGTPVVTPSPIPQRHRMSMNLLYSALANQVNESGPRRTPAAGRHVGDVGQAMRDQISSIRYEEFVFSNETVKNVWARTYIRLKTLRATETIIIKDAQVATNGEGFTITITATGQLAFYSADSEAATDKTLIGTAGVLTVGRWYRLDRIPLFAGIAGAPDIKIGQLNVYLDGAQIAEFQRTLSGTLANVKVSFCRHGRANSSVGDHDVDICHSRVAAVPANRDGMLAHWSSLGVGYVVGDIRHYDGDSGSAGVFSFKAVSAVAAYRCIANHTSSAGNNPVSATTLWEKLNDSPDWLMGSRLVRLTPTGDGPARSGWTGDWRFALQAPGDQGSFAEQLTSTTAGAILDLTTDAPNAHRLQGQRGVVAIGVHMVGKKAGAGATDGTVGVSVNGAAVVEETIVQGGIADEIEGALVYKPTGLSAGVTLASVNIRHTLGTVPSGNAACRSLNAVAELIGMFGPEDAPAGTADVPVFPALHGGQHNRHTPLSPWARAASRGLAPVVIDARTYVGNDTATELQYRVPPHFLWIRRVTGTADTGRRWWAGMVGLHEHVNSGLNPTIQVFRDPTFVPAGGEDDQAERYIVRLIGDDPQLNASAVTYHVTAFCDPGARYALSGSFLMNNEGATPESVALAESTFTPEAGFFWPEVIQQTTTGQAAFKGLGLAASEAVELPGTQRTSYVGFSAGSLSVHKGATGMIDSAYDNVGFIVWRRDDGNGTAEKAFALVSWVGDGTASRTISFGFVTGLRPVWAYVAGSGGSAFFRDPSHTTTNSTNMSSGTQGTTGITAGAPDAMSVGSLLNASGVTYTGIVFMGSATACNGGWSCDGEFIPIEPGIPIIQPWIEPVEIPPPVTPPPALAPSPDIECAATAASTELGGTGPLGSSGVSEGGLVGGQCCEVYTRALLNVALQRIGQSKVIVNVATDTTEEATIARTFVTDQVNQSLRDFPWPFATRYSILALVGGTASVPVNNDWQYSYRTPSGCMFARRIAKAGNVRAFDPAPIRFKRGSDSTGGLIFCDEPTSATIPLVLEWTARITCPAFYGDAMYRDALAWLFAAAFAGSLAKDSKKQEFCLARYQAILNFAEADASNEQQPSADVDGDADWITDRN